MVPIYRAGREGEVIYFAMEHLGRDSLAPRRRMLDSGRSLGLMKFDEDGARAMV